MLCAYFTSYRLGETLKSLFHLRLHCPYCLHGIATCETKKRESKYQISISSEMNLWDYCYYYVFKH